MNSALIKAFGDNADEIDADALAKAADRFGRGRPVRIAEGGYSMQRVAADMTGDAGGKRYWAAVSVEELDDGHVVVALVRPLAGTRGAPRKTVVAFGATSDEIEEDALAQGAEFFAGRPFGISELNYTAYPVKHLDSASTELIKRAAGRPLYATVTLQGAPRRIHRVVVPAPTWRDVFRLAAVVIGGGG